MSLFFFLFGGRAAVLGGGVSSVANMCLRFFAATLLNLFACFQLDRHHLNRHQLVIIIVRPGNLHLRSDCLALGFAHLPNPRSNHPLSVRRQVPGKVQSHTLMALGCIGSHDPAVFSSRHLEFRIHRHQAERVAPTNHILVDSRLGAIALSVSKTASYPHFRT